LESFFPPGHLHSRSGGLSSGEVKAESTKRKRTGDPRSGIARGGRHRENESGHQKQDFSWILVGKAKPDQRKPKSEDDTIGPAELSILGASDRKKRLKFERVAKESLDVELNAETSSRRPDRTRTSQPRKEEVAGPRDNRQYIGASTESEESFFDFDALVAACAQSNISTAKLDLGICDSDWVYRYSQRLISKLNSNHNANFKPELVNEIAIDAEDNIRTLGLLGRSITEVFKYIAWWFAFKFVESGHEVSERLEAASGLETPNLSTDFARNNIGRPNGLRTLFIADSDHSTTSPNPWQGRRRPTPGLSSNLAQLRIARGDSPGLWQNTSTDRLLDCQESYTDCACDC
jgi:hypothetical protein